MQRVYIETSIVSYLRQKPSSQVIAAARQQLTRRWWEKRRSEYDLFTSQFVVDEAAQGDPQLAGERLEVLAGIPRLAISQEIPEIAAKILDAALLPPRAWIDALHIATASHHRIDYLLTWNCKHLANQQVLLRLHDVFAELGCFAPLIITPQEMDGSNEDEY